MVAKGPLEVRGLGAKGQWEAKGPLEVKDPLGVRVLSGVRVLPGHQANFLWYLLAPRKGCLGVKVRWVAKDLLGVKGRWAKASKGQWAAKAARDLLGAKDRWVARG